MRFVVLVCSLVALSGCGLLIEAEDKAAKAGGELVKFYCENATDPAFRERFRGKVNGHAAPHSVRVDCATAAPPLVSSPAP